MTLNAKKKSWLLASGMLAVFFYIIHVVVGGMLWRGYDHIQQPISDLTAVDAPNRHLLLIFIVSYSILVFVFALVFVLLEGKKHVRSVLIGGILFVLLHAFSSMYPFFPEDLPGSIPTLAGKLHIGLTALIVPFTIASPLFVGLGFIKEPQWRTMGSFSILVSLLILIFGSLSGFFYIHHLSHFGLIERLNIGTLQLWTFCLSYNLVRDETSYHPS